MNVLYAKKRFYHSSHNFFFTIFYNMNFNRSEAKELSSNTQTRITNKT